MGVQPRPAEGVLEGASPSLALGSCSCPGFPLARVIQEHIKKPLADEILFGRLVKGGHVKVVLRDGKLAFDIEGDEREKGAPVIESREQEPELAA